MDIVKTERKAGHFVDPKDRERIRCSACLTKNPCGESCGKPAVWCHYMYWGKSGISFFYYCKEHADLRNAGVLPKDFCDHIH